MKPPIQYQSTDSGAPVLTGQVGTLVSVLDACLVTGYGPREAAGWSKAFSGANTAVYRAPQGTRFYLQVVDTGALAGGGREARLRGYESMSGAATGTGPYPTVAQAADGLGARKSATTDATARAWTVFADAQTVYVFTLSGDTAGVYRSWLFGDIHSLLPVDQYHSILVGYTAVNESNPNNDPLSKLEGSNLANNLAGLFCARREHGLGGAGRGGLHGNRAMSNGATGLRGALQFPNPADGGIYFAPVWVHRSSVRVHLRGRLRGFWHFLHPVAAVENGQRIQAAGIARGREIVILKSAPNTGVFSLETTAWDRNHG